jgi:hypothetical protein
VVDGAELYVSISPGIGKRRAIEDLERIISWLKHGEEVMQNNPGTFYCEVQPIPALTLLEQGKIKSHKKAAARFPKGKRRLI